MNIAFRTDATSQIGTGHFMRCLTLADALKSQGAYIRFVSRNLPAHLSEMLKAKGMDFVALPNDVVDERGGDLAHSQWLCASQTQDAHATVQALSDKQWDWIVVDHYALDARWETAARGCAKKYWSLMTSQIVNTIVMCCSTRISIQICIAVITTKYLPIV